eukprot:scaffold80705_cov24-Tisochrysis_lutea.AAC.2
MPKGLPIRRPAPMPRAGATDAAVAALAAAAAAAEALAVAAEPRGTAVFARAKRGMMKKVEMGERRRTARCMRSSCSPFGPVYFARVEMQKAANTPAMSALTPDRSRQYHRTAPPAAKARRSDASVRPKAASPAVTAAVAPRNGSDTWEAKHVARTRIAPRSSTVARVSRKAEAAAGMRLRKRP